MPMSATRPRTRKTKKSKHDLKQEIGRRNIWSGRSAACFRGSSLEPHVPLTMLNGERVSWWHGRTCRLQGCASFKAARISKWSLRTGHTYKIANFLGTGHRIGNKAKQRTKQAKAARLHAPKMSSRSHRLTNAREGVSVEDLH